MTEVDNLQLQSDELEVLHSIYEDKFRVVDAASREYAFSLERVTMEIRLPIEYPLTALPQVQLNAETLSREEKEKLDIELTLLLSSSLGESCLYQLVDLLVSLDPGPALVDIHPDTIVKPKSDSPVQCDVDIVHGDCVTDRKSVFQPHLAMVSSRQEVKGVLGILMSNKKIAAATHNMYAYRLKTPDGNLLQDCDDDGEKEAGSRMLHLLQLCDVMNVLVVVSRWYGGVKLGPDRFRHINNVSRDILDQAGLLKKKLPKKK